jgi:HK97 family phage portal protein
MVAHLSLFGNAYIGKFRNGDGLIDQLALLHPDRVTPELKGGRPVFTVAGSKGERSIHGPGDIIHIKGLSTDGLVGLSPIRECATALGLSANLTDHAATFFENDARPAGIIKLGNDGAVTAEEDRLRIARAWEAGHAGVRNAFKTAVITGSIDYVPISFPPEQAQFLEQRKLSATEIARIFRVPPYMIGADSGASMTYSNVEQESLHFVTYGLRPHLVAIEQALSADADLFLERTYCEYLLDAVIRADSATRAQVYTAALNPETGWMTRAEVRRLENLDPESEAA